MPLSLLFCFVGAVSAILTLSDPSDQINPLDWAADNALLADYTVIPVGLTSENIITSPSYTDLSQTTYQEIANVGPNMWSSSIDASNHQTYTVDANDTSVAVITNGSNLKFTYDCAQWSCQCVFLRHRHCGLCQRHILVQLWPSIAWIVCVWQWHGIWLQSPSLLWWL